MLLYYKDDYSSFYVIINKGGFMRINKSNYNIECGLNLSIVHISDIHYYEKYNFKRLELVKENIKLLSPNYICITGDLIDSGDISCKMIDKLCSWLENLSKISKVIIVLGNHDIEHTIKNKRCYFINEYFLNVLNNIDNVYLLRNNYFKEGNITFIGHELSYEYYEGKNIDIKKSIDCVLKYGDNKFNVLLTHNPSIFFENDLNKLNNINLILCGHTHGGLMPDFFPGHFGIISPKKCFFPKNMRGIHKLDNTTLIISSGIIKLSARTHLSFFNNIYSSNIVNIKLTDAGNKIKKHTLKS